MSDTPVGVAAARASSRRLLSSVSILYLLLVIYGSWVPLRFTPIPLNVAVDAFLALPFHDQRIQSVTDWTVNFLLLIPLSFLVAQRIVGDRRGLIGMLLRLGVAGCGVGLAVFLEFSQLYFPPRTVSQRDVFALSLGGMVGVAAQYAWGHTVGNWLDAVWRMESKQDRLGRLLHIYLLIIFAFSMMPLDLTVSVVELYHKWREGRVVLLPFTGIKGSTAQSLYGYLTDVLIWLPVGVFWALRRRSSLLWTTLSTALAAAAIEGFQLFVYSRVTDTADILLAAAGGMAGGFAAAHGRRWLALIAEAGPEFWFFGWVIVASIVLGVFWYPFGFQMPPAPLDDAWRAIARVPFLMLYQGSEYHAINELLRKTGFFMPVGVLWALFSAARARGIPKRFRPRLADVSGLAFVPFVSEAGQLFLPGRYADLTDVLLGTLGGIAGLVLMRWILAGHDSASGSAEQSPVRAAQRPFRLEKPPSTPWPVWTSHAITFLALMVAISLMAHFVNHTRPTSASIARIVAIALVAAASYLVGTGHVMFLNWAKTAGRLFLLPLWLVAQGLVVWTLLQPVVSIDRFYSFIGAPVLGWPWNWELIGRFLALHAVVALAALGALLFALLVFERGNVAAFLTWTMFTAMLAWPLHFVIFDLTASGGMTQIMRGGGSFVTSAVLGLGALGLFLAAASVGAFIAFADRRPRAALIAAAAATIATIAFWYGLEPTVLEHGKMLSALQFMPSTSDLEKLAAPARYARHAVTYAVLAVALGLIQFSHLRAGEQRGRW
ncbi:VanZ family protein [Propionivibrio soli]|uniref:VanZ family protein n=1 Tax=Propionivibrio soli TaxID=2976531 RepID=UPI0021E8CB6A|nr:VanZ family protein [Propionivibrio soli]